MIKIKQIEGVADETINAYHRLFNDFDKFFGEGTDVTKLTEDDAIDYVHWQLNEKTPYEFSSRQDLKHEKGVSVKTANSYLIMAKSAFNVLNQRGITDHIFKDIKTIKEHEKQIDTLTVNEINKLFKEFDKTLYTEFRDYVICNVLLDGFARIGETLEVRVDDIDFDKKAITFKRTKGKRIRTVPLSNQTLKLLEELIEENEEFDTDYVFLTIFGEQLDTDTFRKRLDDIAERAEIKTNVYPHIFRHTASKMFIEQGGNLRVLQLILGHASVETTQRYAHT